MKLAILLIMSMVVVLIGNMGILYHSSKKTVESSISQFAIDISENISSHLDASLYEEFLRNPVESETYWELRDSLNDFRVKTGALYVYTMAVDTNKNVSILIDGMPKHEKKASSIGEATSVTAYKDIEAALEGKTASTPVVYDPDYGEYLSAFVPIKNGNDVIGILGVDINAKNVSTITDKVLKSQLPVPLAFNVLLTILIIVPIIWLMGRRLAPLQTLSIAAEQISNGDLLLARNTVDTIRVKGQDEIHQVTQSFKHMMKSMVDIVEDINKSSQLLYNLTLEINKKMLSMSEANDQIVSGIHQVAGAATTQLDRSEESVEAITEMAIGIQRIADASADVSEQSGQVTTRVREGFKEIQSIIYQINIIKETVGRSSHIIKELGNQANEIESIVELISRISEQTNLLALNAAIEAARAGEHGKGFAVVSQEVRKLAEESKTSAKEIGNRLHSFKSTVEQAVLNMDIGTQEVEKGTASISRTDEKFSHILEAVNTVTGEIQEVSAITEQMSAGSEEISAAIVEFASLSKNTADISKEVSDFTTEQETAMENVLEFTEKLQSLSESLEKSIKKFKL